MSNANLIGAGVYVVFFGLMLWRRTAAMRKPIKGKGAVMIWPLLFFLPGFLMFSNPEQPFNGNARRKISKKKRPDTQRCQVFLSLSKPRANGPPAKK